MLPNLKCFNNGQKLTVMNFVFCFSENYLLRKKDYWMPLTQIIQGQLTKNSTNCIAKSISFNTNITF